MISLRKMRWKLFLLGLVRIPIIGFVRPKLISINNEEIVVSIALRRRTKNHLNSMYFGALAVGADVAAGILAYYHSEILQRKTSLAFKAMKAEFLKRAESDIRFVCSEGKRIENMLQTCISSGERQNESITVYALNNLGEQVAVFEMILSLKVLK
jgi:acyl-coenzyme A thioesterase PaaI-like protein